MEVVSNNYMPSDPRLIQQLVYELKSQGIFDQFRKECIADVDTKPAYQNLRQRVEGSVISFLKQQTWRPDMNKNQVREQLRKSIYESGYLETGVERIVDQVVNPKINTVFLPQVEDVVYRYLGIEKPNRSEVKKELKIDVTDLLPTDLEAVSPESDHTDKRDDSFNLSDSLNTDSKIEEDESPPFEPLEVQQNFVQHEDNSVDSHLSGFSGLQSHDSNPCTEIKLTELSNQDSQVSRNSSESYLSVITSEENTKMEVCEDSESKILKTIESETKMEISIVTYENSEIQPLQKDTEDIKINEKTELDIIISDKKVEERKSDYKRSFEKKVEEKKAEDKKHEDKKNDKKSDDKKSRSSDKRSSSKDKKDPKKDDKYRKNSSSNSGTSNREKEKSSSKHSSSSPYKDKSKDRKDVKSNSSSNKEKEKEKDKSEKEKNKEKKELKSNSSSGKEKEKSEKEKSENEKSDKDKSHKDREKSDRDKSKSSSSGTSKHSSSSGSNSSSKDKERSIKKEPSMKDKEKSRSSSLSTSKDSNPTDSKSKSSSNKHKTSHSSKHSSSSSSSYNVKKDKDKKRESKKESKDDHYSAKEKKHHRRSTDRDSNDGQSSKQSHSASFSGSSSSSSQKNVQESSNSNTGSGSGDSGSSDQVECSSLKLPIKLSEKTENKDVIIPYVDVQKLKYIKPKFASNFQEARKLMKIRKQLAKLERQNQLSLAQIEIPVELTVVNGLNYDETDSVETVEVADVNKEVINSDRKENIISPKDSTPVLQSTDLTRESWEALEARLAQEMSNVNYNSYESPYDDYECGGYNSIVISPRKNNKVADVKCAATKEKMLSLVECPKFNNVHNEQLTVAIHEKYSDLTIEIIKEDIGPKTSINSHLLEKDKLIIEQKEENNHCNSPQDIVQHIPNSLNEQEDLNKNVRIEIEEKNYLLPVDDAVKCIANEEEIIEEKNTPNKRCTKINLEVVHRNETIKENASDANEQCRYLERPSPSLEKHLQFIYKYVGRLERDITYSIKSSQNKFLALKRGRKRKLDENVDLKNNNRTHYEQTTELRKRRRSTAPNSHSVILKANKEKMCNSTDISPDDRFSLPLSPAESDKSNDKKDEELPKTAKQKGTVINKSTTRSQRYSSDDLYKPRPIIASSRRNRGAKNSRN